MLSIPSDYSCLVSAAPVVSGIKSKPSCHITASEEKTMWGSFGMQKQFFGCHTQKWNSHVYQEKVSVPVQW